MTALELQLPATPGLQSENRVTMAAPETAKPDSKAPVVGLFATTHWSVVLAARNRGTLDASAALERLCQTYWPPLYAYLRQFGYAPEEAQDLTQDFFAHFLEGNCFNRADPRRGRFRSFLLTCLQNYARDLHDGRTATKRGGNTRVLSLDQERAERGYAAEPVELTTPERVFEKRWATTLLENVLDHLGAEFTRTGKREFFDQLKGFVWGSKAQLRSGRSPRNSESARAPSGSRFTASASGSANCCGLKSPTP
jgi:RNA polymerase sigma factor (sigma-70 family)